MSGTQGSLVRGLGWVRQHPKKDQQRGEEGRPPARRLPRTWNPRPTTPTAPNPARGSRPAQTWGFRWYPKQTLELYTCVCVCGGGGVSRHPSSPILLPFPSLSGPSSKTRTSKTSQPKSLGRRRRGAAWWRLPALNLTFTQVQAQSHSPHSLTQNSHNNPVFGYCYYRYYLYFANRKTGLCGLMCPRGSG